MTKNQFALLFSKYCSSTCKGYANQAKNLNEAAPWNEEDRTVDALLSQVAYLKGQLQNYINENAALKKMIGESHASKS